MGVYYKLRQCKITKSKVNGKWFAHAASLGIIDYDELCRHIASHGSPFTEDICLGVGKKLLSCIQEHLLSGYKVRFGDMGMFYLSIRSEGTDSVSEFNAQKHITNIYLRFMPNLSAKTNLSSLSLLKAASLADINSLAAKEALDKKAEEQAEADDVTP